MNDKSALPIIIKERIAVVLDIATDIAHDAGRPIPGDDGSWRDGALWAIDFFARQFDITLQEESHE